ncbi:hypothetical protein FRACYDRAFT_251847 [Fragilariopsis cylindrus CCMP1102]|uniref:Uncharacterized protein n=1 Tax=Fragilariopsis cylindrus CCMP1102 TaxID=635003 RepID=A0A1E7EMF5_9STRA|nr:hypothetical protein FRACYDRAFT_251847 [Fragilariopsis cylindrus CCMP1102]|eukprot:OEU07110.1 hypothetical protein FRACYDRAFT_251847 [Fragilariopsis cylindrus CCMP1102]
MFRRPNTKPPPPMSRDIFSMGACVRVDPSTTKRKVDVKYNENSIGIINSSQFINEEILHAQSFDLLGGGGGGGGGGNDRSGRRRCIEFGGGAATAVVTPPPPTITTVRRRKRKRNRPKNIYDAIKDSRTWLPYNLMH